MKAGDIITDDQLPDAMNALPERAVAVCVGRNDDFNVLIRTADGFDWYGRGGRISHYSAIHAGDWTLVHLPAVPALKVGDVIETEGQAKALPVGTVAVDDGGDASSAPAIKVGANRWMYYDGAGTARFSTDFTPIDHEIVYIPSADTGAVRTAA